MIQNAHPELGKKTFGVIFILNLISKRYKTKEYNNDKPLVFVTTNTPLTRHLQFHKILEPTPELQSNSLCQLLFTKHKGSYQPITAHRRTKNLKDQLTQSTYNHELKTLPNKQQYWWEASILITTILNSKHKLVTLLHTIYT